MNSILLRRSVEIDGGATGRIYTYGHDKVVKVFSPSYPFWKIEREYDNARLFNEAGLPSPECYEIVSTDKGFGIIFERIDGVSLTKAISEQPAKLDGYIRKMIALMRKVHQADIDLSSVGSAKERYLEYLAECYRYYDERDLASLRALIRSIPDKENLLHGDFHTGNVMVDKNDDLILIDFSEVCYGHPVFDVIAEGAVIPVTLENDPKLAESYLGISSELMREIWASYIRHYFPNVTYVDSLMAEARLISRLRNAITAAITYGIPETYLANCAENTHSILIPKIPELIRTMNWGKWK